MASRMQTIRGDIKKATVDLQEAEARLQEPAVATGNAADIFTPYTRPKETLQGEANGKTAGDSAAATGPGNGKGTPNPKDQLLKAVQQWKAKSEHTATNPQPHSFLFVLCRRAEDGQ
eukprot:GHVS01000692.1.p1 GENE.GHVS01000692.1~~GHVS01000692.1.p1  ORF type:complete len:117 (-),score=13.17 GHVS01000692.1:1193-1543(-)